MYKITRNNRIHDEIQLCHANGDVALSVDVDLNVDEIAGRLNKARETLASAQAAMKKNETSEAKLEAYGNAVLGFFGVIFGEENTAKIVEFYEGRYSEMLLDLFPFINNELMPKIYAASAARREQLLAAAKMVKSDSKKGWRR